MRKRGIIILGGVALVAVAAATVAVRTASFAPANVADGSDVRIAAAPPYDLDAAVRHLSEAAQIPTVSNQDPADNQIAEWDRLHAWLASTYPAAHGAMTRTILPNKTLVYYWSGSDASLNAPLRSEGESEWQDWLADDSVDQETRLAEREEMGDRHDLLVGAMKDLTERERDILQARRLQDEPATLEELSQKYGVSRERVRQIEVRAFEKLQRGMQAAVNQAPKSLAAPA